MLRSTIIIIANSSASWTELRRNVLTGACWVETQSARHMARNLLDAWRIFNCITHVTR